MCKNLTCKQWIGLMIVGTFAVGISALALYLFKIRGKIGVELDTKTDNSHVETVTQKFGIMQYYQKLTGTIALNDHGNWNLDGKLKKEMHQISLSNLKDITSHSNHAITTRIAIVVSGIWYRVICYCGLAKRCLQETTKTNSDEYSHGVETDPWNHGTTIR